MSLIQGSSDHLLRIIDDILNYSAIEAAKLELYFSETNIGETVNAAISMLCWRYEEKRVSLSTHVAANTSIVMADGCKSLHAFVNLFSNAVNFMQEGSNVFWCAERSGCGGYFAIERRAPPYGGR